MSSILTNNGAMVALQTLKSINNDLSETQSIISTGKSVGSAKDNAAIWAISKVMESDVQGFTAISSSLSLGESTVAVARQGSETVTDLLTEMKDKIVASQESNVDREKIQQDIGALRDQITSVVGAAQFNGLNLLSNTDTEAGSGTVSVLSSLDRSGSGVAASNIDIKKNDLGTGQAEIAATGGAFTASIDSASLTATQTGTIDLGANNQGFEAGTGYAITMFGVDADSSSFTPGDLNTSAAATVVQADTAGSEVMYVTRDGDTAEDVAKGLQAAFEKYASDNDIDASVLSSSVSGDTITFSSTVTDATDTINVNLSSVSAAADNTIGGGLSDLANIDVTTDDGARDALSSIEGLISKAIDSAAAFGSAQGRIETQSEFVGKITDALKSGIGSLVDADMEAASARLQALQVQQQLGVQSLSIANQAPQSILSLFR